MVGVWLMTPGRHWWLKNVRNFDDYLDFVNVNSAKLQPGHYFDNCRAVHADGDGGKCDLRAKWGHSLRDYSDEALEDLFAEFRITMFADERFAEWLVRHNTEATIASTSLV